MINGESATGNDQLKEETARMKRTGHGSGGAGDLKERAAVGQHSTMREAEWVRASERGSAKGTAMVVL